ncbi:hypothetical protein BKA64DRAFT_686284 [Cadophora sp. MPI-SDFR-AT-0126]|nr:hypothetical protein BKA64DRAFT_686284 [Leotiomycetes sp. MPI-SDFR-AT-0126]
MATATSPAPAATTALPPSPGAAVSQIQDAQIIAPNIPANEAGNSQAWSLRILSSPGAEEAYQELQDAVDIFNREVTAKKKGEHIEKRVQFSSLLVQAQKDLDECIKKPEPEKSKLRHAWYQTKRGLEKFCKYAMQYSKVMDVMVSAHPEIAALAWGAMKFLLVVSVSHQELKAQITYHMGEIGAKFQIMECFVQLYPSDAMVSNVCGAYTEFLAFLRKSIEWCKEAVLVKFFKTVFSSYETRIKPTIDNLNDYIEKIRTSAEVNRSIGIYNIQAGNLMLQNLMAAFGQNMQLQVQESAEFRNFMRQYITTEQSRRTSIDNKLRSRKLIDKAVFQDSATLRKSLFPELLDVEESFKKDASRSRRMPKSTSYIDLGILDKPEITVWLKLEESSLLWIDGFATPSTLKWTTELAVDITLAGDREGYTVLFYFCDISSPCQGNDEGLRLGSQFSMLHSFIIQIIQQHPSIVARKHEYFNVEAFQAAKVNLKNTLTIFREALKALSEHTTVCIIIDSLDNIRGAKERSPRLQFILEKLSEIVVTPRDIVVKIIITSVTSNIHELIIPDVDNPPPHHHLLRIPRSLENAHTIRQPSHLSRRIPRQLVRIPDETLEFGMMPEDGFELSDGDDEDESDMSQDDVIPETGLRHFENKKKAIPATLIGDPFKTIREENSGYDNDDAEDSSEISVSEDDAALKRRLAGKGHVSNDEMDLSSTDSDVKRLKGP